MDKNQEFKKRQRKNLYERFLDAMTFLKGIQHVPARIDYFLFELYNILGGIIEGYFELTYSKEEVPNINEIRSIVNPLMEEANKMLDFCEDCPNACPYHFTGDAIPLFDAKLKSNDITADVIRKYFPNQTRGDFFRWELSTRLADRLQAILKEDNPFKVEFDEKASFDLANHVFLGILEFTKGCTTCPDACLSLQDEDGICQFCRRSSAVVKCPFPKEERQRRDASFKE